MGHDISSELASKVSPTLLDIERRLLGRQRDLDERERQLATREHLLSLSQRELAFYQAHREVAGLRAEFHVLQLVNGQQAPKGSGFDILARNGTQLEVKFSRPRRVKKSGVTRRWEWTGIIDKSKNRLYHQVILVGPADARYREQYKDRFSPYVMFNIPYSEVANFVIKGKRGTRGITLCTNKAGAGLTHLIRLESL